MTTTDLLPLTRRSNTFCATYKLATSGQSATATTRTTTNQLQSDSTQPPSRSIILSSGEHHLVAPTSSGSMEALAMANRHLLFGLSRQSRFLLAQTRLLTIPTIILISLLAFVISAANTAAAAHSPSSIWQTQTQFHRSSPAIDPNQAAARQALELRLLRAANSQQQQPFDDQQRLLLGSGNVAQQNSRDNQVIRQLILARNLLDERIGKSKPASSPPNQLIDMIELDSGNLAGADNSFNDQPNENHYYQIVGGVDESNGNDAGEDLEDERARSQLADLLLLQQEESSSATASATNDDGDDDEFNTKSSSFSSPYLQLPQLASPLSSDQIREAELVERLNDNNLGEQQFAGIAAADKRQESPRKDGAEQEPKQREAKFTTLLEDESNSTASATSSPVEVETTTAVSYGKLVDDSSKINQNQNQTRAEQRHGDHQSASSVFSRFMENLASYVPFLSGRKQSAAPAVANMTTAKAAPEDNEVDTKQKEKNKKGAKTISVDVKRAKNDAFVDADLMMDNQDGASAARQRVSNPMAATSTSPGSPSSDSNDKTMKQLQPTKGDDDKIGSDDSQNSGKVRVRVDSAKQRKDDDDSFSGTFSKPNDNRLFVNNNMKRVSLDSNENDNQQQQYFGNPSESLLVGSNNPVGYNNNQNDPTTLSLFDGKYIYAAPAAQQQQHYYNSQLYQQLPMMQQQQSSLAPAITAHHPTGGASIIHHHQSAPAMLVKHHQVFHPNEHIFATYEPLKPAYAYQKGGMEGILLGGGAAQDMLSGNRTSSSTTPNDLYFLVMVGAFCVMAMAVVLAAGLFAYRVQQQRKSSQDTDYPTYGVVGPNNMNGKCGAASFVGGYLGNNIAGAGGPGSSGSFGSNKSGCSATNMRHLPADLYASDSGLASTDKGSSKKASLASASSDNNNNTAANSNNHSMQPQQQQQQQQVANHRGTPANFMMAANQDAARMYHYQHQKQQMIISDRSSAGRHTSASDLDSDDDNEDGSYTVYECPGLASAHEMEIKNPLFNDDQTP